MSESSTSLLQLRPFASTGGDARRSIERMVRFGIAGFGLHAVRRLMPGFAQARGCQVTALSRRDMAAARESAAQYKIPLAFDSVADLCRSPEVDAVLVTTPNALHLSDVMMAIAHGKPVLCEKPMGTNAGECKQM